MVSEVSELINPTLAQTRSGRLHGIIKLFWPCGLEIMTVDPVLGISETAGTRDFPNGSTKGPVLVKSIWDMSRNPKMTKVINRSWQMLAGKVSSCSQKPGCIQVIWASNWKHPELTGTKTFWPQKEVHCNISCLSTPPQQNIILCSCCSQCWYVHFISFPKALTILLG